MDTPRAGDLRVGTVVVNVQDMARAVDFWCEALGYQLRDGEPGRTFTTLVDRGGNSVSVSLQLSHRAPVEPVRVHLDLFTTEQAWQVERLVELGATRVDDWPYPEDPDFVVLRDPDGNEFCVIDQG